MSLLVLGLAPLALASSDTYKATIAIPVYSKTVMIPANAVHTINITIPSGINATAVKVVMSGYSENVKLTAYIENNVKVAEITVVPLASGDFSTTLPATTTKIELSVTQVWEGTITVLVESSIEFQVTPPSTIRVVNGTGSGTMTVKQVRGPAGKIFLLDDSLDFDVQFRDPQPEYSGDFTVETTGAGWQANVPVVVTTSVKNPGTYRINVQMWFSSDIVGVQPVLVANLSMDVGVGTAGSSSFEQAKEWLKDKWMYVGAGLVVLMLLFLALPKRRGMAGLSGNLFTLLLFLLVIVLGITIAFLDQTHALALGVGVGAFLILLLLLQSGKLKLG